MADRLRRGMETRRQVLGDDHVDRATETTTALDDAFQEYITGAAWADVWSRPQLPRETRSLITIALVSALGHERELEMHLRAARRTGATREQIVEALLHVAVYAGVPAAHQAFRVLKRTISDQESHSAE